MQLQKALVVVVLVVLCVFGTNGTVLDSVLFKWVNEELILQPKLNNSANIAVNTVLNQNYIASRDNNNANSSGIWSFSSYFNTSYSPIISARSAQLNISYASAVHWLTNQTLLIGTNNGLSIYYPQRNYSSITPPSMPGITGISSLSSLNQIYICATGAGNTGALYILNYTLDVSNQFLSSLTLLNSTSLANQGTYGIHHDCNGGFFAIVQCQVLHYPPNSLTPDFSINQTSPQSICPSNSFFTTQIRSVILNQNCSTMWIGDAGRILRYNSPFNSGSLPTGVLGASVLLGYNVAKNIPKTFSVVNDMYYNDTSQQLYILDYYNHSVLIGNTDLGTPGQILYGNISIGSGTILKLNNTVNSSDTLIIGGDLVLSEGGGIELKEGERIVVGGCVEFGGNISVEWSGDENDLKQAGKEAINWIEYGCRQNAAEFGAITVLNSGGNLDDRCRLKGEGQYGATTFSVLVSLADPQCLGSGDGGNNSNKTNLIIGLVVGIGGFLALVAIVVIAVAFGIGIMKKRELKRIMRYSDGLNK